MRRVQSEDGGRETSPSEDGGRETSPVRGRWS